MTSESAKELAELIIRCSKNEQKAHKRLFDILSPKMYAICLRYAKNSDDAKDFLQEGFIKLFKNLHQFQGKGSFEGWVKKIFINNCIEHYRKLQKRFLNTDIEDCPETIIQPSTIDKLKELDLMQIIQQLPLGYRTVFNLFAIEGYTHEEIASQLNISVNTSKSQLFKARQHLQEIILKQNLK